MTTREARYGTFYTHHHAEESKGNEARRAAGIAQVAIFEFISAVERCEDPQQTHQLVSDVRECLGAMHKGDVEIPQDIIKEYQLHMHILEETEDNTSASIAISEREVRNIKEQHPGIEFAMPVGHNHKEAFHQ